MPTYDYECNHCGHAFECFQTISETPLRKCPECGKRQLNRLFGTGAAVMFRGSGFYQTDYRSDSYKKGAEAEKKVTTTDSTGGNGKSSEAKTAKAAKSKETANR